MQLSYFKLNLQYPFKNVINMVIIHFAFRIRATLKTVDNIWIYGEDIEFGSDSDISDASEIWSEYGDEIVVDKQPKNLRWDPSDKKVGQRLSLREKGIKKATTKKKKLVGSFLN